jgi:hypothetical protein
VSRIVADRFVLGSLLGSGGVAEVYRARDRATGAEVALKELLPQFAADRAVRRRFLREAEVARRLDHPGIVPVLAAGEEGGRPYLVMELVEGEDLRRRLDRAGPLPFEEVRAMVVAIAGALDHAHARGVVHRDLKPQNVLLGERVRLCDFGLARVQTLASLTGSSLVWGSPEYMAPELFGRGRADPRSDLFSLGVLLFELATGRLPWKDRSLARLMTAVGDARAPLPSLGQGAAVDQLVAALLAPTPADRPSSAAEVIAVLEGRAAPPALVRMVPCGGCGEPRPEDVPQCFSCGQRDLGGGHVIGGRWSVVLKSIGDDVASMESIHQALGGLTGRGDLRLKFLVGSHNLYSKKEQAASIALPAVLFSHLDESSARQVEAALQARGLKAVATRRRVVDLFRHRPARAGLVASVAVTSMTGAMALTAPGMAPVVAVGAGVTAVVALYWTVKLRGLRGLFQLRGRGLPAPDAERLLGAAQEAGSALSAAEVRALFVEVSRELYRLTRRAEELTRKHPHGSSEEALARRLLEAAPSVSDRMQALARRLQTLDAALERESDGDTMRALAVLERRLSIAPTPELESARRELEATLERRHALEAERERLAATLCGALATLRDSYRRARTLVTLEEREATAVARALEQLESELAASE